MLVFVAGIKGQYQESSDCYEDPPKSLLKSSRPPKIPESKISNPKISFTHPHHLKSGDPPPPPGTYGPFKRQITAATLLR